MRLAAPLFSSRPLRQQTPRRKSGFIGQTGQRHRAATMYLENADHDERAVAVRSVSLLQNLYLQPDPKLVHIVLVRGGCRVDERCGWFELRTG